jgi:hypothetical protein
MRRKKGRGGGERERERKRERERERRDRVEILTSKLSNLHWVCIAKKFPSKLRNEG